MSAIAEITARWWQILKAEGPDALVGAIRDDVVSDSGDTCTRALLSLGNLWGSDAVAVAQAVSRSLERPAVPVETDRIRALRERLAQRETEHRELAQRSEQATLLKHRHKELLREKAQLAREVALLRVEAEGVRARLGAFARGREPDLLVEDAELLRQRHEHLANRIAQLEEELSRP